MVTFNTPLSILNAGTVLRADSNGNVGFFNTSGTEMGALQATGTVLIILDSANTNAIQASTSNVLVGSGGHNLQVNKLIAYYNGINTTGIGVPPVYASTVQNPVNAAPSTMSYTPPATAGLYRVSYYLDITTATTITFIVKLTYTDPAGTARSPNIMLINEGGTAVLAGGPAANTAGQWSGTMTFAIDASATAITLANNAGTYTTCNYRWQAVLQQLI